MKKITLITLALCFSIFGAFAQEQITISRFQGKKITGIEAHGAFNITAKQGTSTGITVNIPARYEKQLLLELDADGKLLLSIEGRTSNNEKPQDKRFLAEITFTTLEEIDLSGACKLETVEKFTADQLDIDLSGATKVLLGEDFLVKKNLKIEMSGSSSVRGQITSPESDFDISGASTLQLTGNALRCQLELSGASRASLETFPINILKAEISGASKADLQVIEEISISTSGASKATYSGDPKVLSQASSGASKINRVAKRASETKKEYQK